MHRSASWGLKTQQSLCPVWEGGSSRTLGMHVRPEQGLPTPTLLFLRSLEPAARERAGAFRVLHWIHTGY